MSSGIYLVDGDGELLRMEEAKYDSEDVLQRLLADYPDLLAGDQMHGSDPRRWILVRREARVPAEDGGGGRWAVDHLFLDQDGIPTLVEVKRSSNTEIRRQAVGQLLDYAANATAYWPVEQLIADHAATCREAGVSPEEAIHEHLRDDDDHEGFWTRVKTNLQAGRVRLVFVADRVPPELRRIVEFLNAQMDPCEVIAVEVKQYVGEGQTALVPTVVGLTAQAQRRKGSPGGAGRPPLTEQTFFEELAIHCDQTAVDGARAVLKWLTENVTRVEWQRSMLGRLRAGEVEYTPVALYPDGKIDFQLMFLARRPAFAAGAVREELVERIRALPGATVPENAANAFPYVMLGDVPGPTVLESFIDTLAWTVAQIHAHHEEPEQ